MKLKAATREATRDVLVFVLGKEEYGVDILKVQEIRGYDKVTPIPSAPDYLKGVLNLRGVIVPILDMRVKFRLPEVRYDQLTVVVILRLGDRVLGLVVDGVSDVMALNASEVKPPPNLGSVVDGSYIAGVGTQNDHMVLLLDIEKLLSSGELKLLDEAAAGSAVS